MEHENEILGLISYIEEDEAIVPHVAAIEYFENCKEESAEVERDDKWIIVMSLSVKHSMR